MYFHNCYNRTSCRKYPRSIITVPPPKQRKNESTVKSMKKSFTQHGMVAGFLDHDKFCRAFLQYRTHPLERTNYLQLRSFMVALPRIPRGIPFLPTITHFLVKAELPGNVGQAEVEQQAKTTKESITTYYNAHAHPLIEIWIGSNVAIQHPCTKLWTQLYGIVTHWDDHPVGSITSKHPVAVC